MGDHTCHLFARPMFRKVLYRDFRCLGYKRRSISVFRDLCIKYIWSSDWADYEAPWLVIVSMIGEVIVLVLGRHLCILGVSETRNLVPVVRTGGGGNSSFFDVERAYPTSMEGVFRCRSVTFEVFQFISNLSSEFVVMWIAAVMVI